MNHEDLFEAIGSVDAQMLEQSERKPRYGKKVLFAAVAACLALAITVGLLNRPSETGIQRLICADKITWSVDSGVRIKESDSVLGSMDSFWSPSNQFAFSMAIEAKVLEVLPDLYAFPGMSTGLPKYHVLRLQVLDEITATGLPRQIYYLLPETLDPNLTGFDSLILNMEQKGVDHYQLINETTRQVEAFSFVFGESYCSAANGAVMAFTDGKLDMSLWDKEGWIDCRYAVQNTIAGGEYPGSGDRSIRDTKKAIIQQAERYKENGQYWFHSKLVTADYFDMPGAKEVFEYVKAFENGTFRQYLSIDPLLPREYLGVDVRFERIINGFGTNEVLYLYRSFDGLRTETNRGKVQFTEEDMHNLPNLASVIEQMEQYVPEAYQGDAFDKRFCGVSGKYYKMDDQIYGVVTIEWGNGNYTPPKAPTCLIERRVWDWSYILVRQDGTAQIVTEDELKDYIG